MSENRIYVIVHDEIFKETCKRVAALKLCISSEYGKIEKLDDLPPLDPNPEMITVKKYDDDTELRFANGEYHADFELITMWEGGAVILRGFIKWDGCVYWDTNDSMMHFCYPEDADKFAEKMKDIWRYGREYIAARTDF